MVPTEIVLLNAHLVAAIVSLSVLRTPRGYQLQLALCSLIAILDQRCAIIWLFFSVLAVMPFQVDLLSLLTLSLLFKSLLCCLYLLLTSAFR